MSIYILCNTEIALLIESTNLIFFRILKIKNKISQMKYMYIPTKNMDRPAKQKLMYKNINILKYSKIIS